MWQKGPVAALWCLSSNTEFTRTKSQLASHRLAGKHCRSYRMFTSHFLAVVQAVQSCAAVAAAQQGPPLVFYPSQGRNFPTASPKLPKFVRASMVSSMNLFIQRGWASQGVFSDRCLQFKHFLLLFVKYWGQIFSLKTRSFGKSEPVSCLCECRRTRKQNERFREENVVPG